MADFDEVAALLHIHEKASAHGELLRGIADTAMQRLRQINEEHLASRSPAPKPIPVGLKAEEEPPVGEAGLPEGEETVPRDVTEGAPKEEGRRV